jgi:hypothetical protein
MSDMEAELIAALEHSRELRSHIYTLETRIEQLEAALREIVDNADNGEWTLPSTFGNRARAALDNLCEDEGCPNTGTPHVCINRQENDDVFKGFRGNNEA